MIEMCKCKHDHPRVVHPSEFGFLARLKASWGIITRFGNLFLGYCRGHDAYFLDLKHTNGCVRCPICDKAWLKKWDVKKICVE